MSRRQRVQFAGARYHVTCRGNGGARIFTSRGDPGLFLFLLGRVLAEFRWTCLAYCLMGNHYHLVLETSGPDLSGGMQRLNHRFVRAFHARHGTTGHLFEGPFDAVLVQDDDQLFATCRYVLLNPVRAGLVEHPGDWRWSSHRATVGLEEGPPWLGADRVVRKLDYDDLAQSRAAFERFVLAGVGKQGRGK